MKKMEILIFTRSGETYGGGNSGFGVDEDELERMVGGVGCEEVIQSPLQSVGAVLAVVDSYHHHLLFCYCFCFCFCWACHFRISLCWIEEWQSELLLFLEFIVYGFGILGVFGRFLSFSETHCWQVMRKTTLSFSGYPRNSLDALSSWFL